MEYFDLNEKSSTSLLDCALDVRCAMSIGLFQKYTAIVLSDLDVTVVTAKLMIRLLPFVIAGSSWRDRGKMLHRLSTMEE